MTRATAVQLPAHLSLRIDALCAQHPGTARQQLVTELLDLGLRAMERGASAPAPVRADPQQSVYLPGGAFAEFHALVYKHHLAHEMQQSCEDLPASTTGYDLSGCD